MCGSCDRSNLRRKCKLAFTSGEEIEPYVAYRTLHFPKNDEHAYVPKRYKMPLNVTRRIRGHNGKI